jgi:hypothetical protein
MGQSTRLRRADGRKHLNLDRDAGPRGVNVPDMTYDLWIGVGRRSVASK